nr:hypothetical protein [Morchella crassipes]
MKPSPSSISCPPSGPQGGLPCTHIFASCPCISQPAISQRGCMLAIGRMQQEEIAEAIERPSDLTGKAVCTPCYHIHTATSTSCRLPDDETLVIPDRIPDSKYWYLEHTKFIFLSPPPPPSSTQYHMCMQSLYPPPAPPSFALLGAGCFVRLSRKRASSPWEE